MSEKGLPFLCGETDFHKTFFFQNEKMGNITFIVGICVANVIR